MGYRDCECILTWVPWSLNFLHFLSHWLQQHWCALLVISASNFFSLCTALSLLLCPCAAALTTAVWLVWHQWFCSPFPPLLLTVCDLSLCLVSHAFMRLSLLTPRMGARLLNVYSNVFHQWCRARWTECNHVLCVFIRLWLPLFSLPVSFSISLCVFATAHCLMKSLCECLFSPPGCNFFLFLNRTTMVICQLLGPVLLDAAVRPTLFLKTKPSHRLQKQERPDANGWLVPRLSIVVLLWPVSLFGHSDLDRDFWNNNDSSTVQQRWSSYPPKEFVLNISPYAPYGDPRLTLKWVLVQGW